jgi:hypothetical protein
MKFIDPEFEIITSDLDFFSIQSRFSIYSYYLEALLLKQLPKSETIINLTRKNWLIFI